VLSLVEFRIHAKSAFTPSTSPSCFEHSIGPRSHRSSPRATRGTAPHRAPLDAATARFRTLRSPEPSGLHTVVGLLAQFRQTGRVAHRSNSPVSCPGQFQAPYKARITRNPEVKVFRRPLTKRPMLACACSVTTRAADARSVTTRPSGLFPRCRTCRSLTE
jgi:hypothetical protein